MMLHLKHRITKAFRDNRGIVFRMQITDRHLRFHFQ